MSEPQTIREYLADFNAYLEVGLRSRRRIFLEVSDHLWQRIERELREGVSRAVAERRAIAAFGSPEEVARSFHAGLVGALDRRLALSTRRLQVWMAAHRWRAAVTKIALLALVSGAAAAVAALAGARAPVYVLGLFVAGVMWMVWLGPHAPLRGRGFPARAKWPKNAPHDPDFYAAAFTAAFAGPIVIIWMTMVDGYSDHFPYGQFVLSMLLVLGTYWVVDGATDLAVDRAARRRAPATQHAGRPSWEAEHPWRAALFEIWSLPLASLALILFFPAPLGLRVAFTVLLVAVTALLAVGLCLNRSLQEQGSYARSLEKPT